MDSTENTATSSNGDVNGESDGAIAAQSTMRSEFQAIFDKNERLYRRYNVMMVGREEVGKTTIFQRLNNMPFLNSMRCTLGIRTYEHRWILDGLEIRFTVVDVCEPRNFEIDDKRYIITHGVIGVYDTTKRSTFDDLPEFFDMIDQIRGGRPYLKFLLGNKSDLFQEREVSFETAKEYAKQIGAPLFECSGKYGVNTEQTFVTVMAHVMDAEKKGKLEFIEFRGFPI